jgi:hypothetical protein
LFYGGKQRSASCELLQDLVIKFAAELERITILDVHSGLGPSGTATLIGNTNRYSKDTRQSELQALFNQPVIMDDNSGNAYKSICPMSSVQ